jgi:hypothetical protein
LLVAAGSYCENKRCSEKKNFFHVVFC